MTQYKTQYGTIFAVKEHNGAPAIMYRAELSETWSLSSMITPFTHGAWTSEELQGQLDNWAATKGWQPVAEPASACLCETCTCTGCHEDCFGHCKGCGHPVDHCNSYQTEGEKRLRAEPASAEPPEIVDEGSGAEDGFPGWVRPMVEAFLQFDFVRELPAFTTAAFKNSEPVRHHWGGSLANGLYDTDPKGISFTVFRSDNSDQYREAHYTWADFVRRCKAAGLAPEPHQDKEDAPCNTKPTAPTGAAAATTAVSAAPMPSTAAGTTTTSAIGADAGTSLPGSSCKGAPNSSPAPASPADAGAAAQSLCAAEPASLEAKDINVPTFDFGADADTNAALMQDAQIFMAGSMARVMAAKRAHDRTANNYRGSWGKWCDLVGISRDTGDNMVRVAEQFGNIQIDGQNLIDIQPLKLLYAASKPSTPPEIRERVENLDITTYKQYQDAMTRIRTLENKVQQYREIKDAALETAKQQREKTAAAESRARAAERERDEARKERDGAREALQASKMRGDKLKAENEALKAQPVEAQVVDEEEVNRRAQARADELTAPLREELEALRARHPTDFEEAEQAIRDAYDSAIYTGRVMENAWHTLRPLLPRMDADRRQLALNQIINIISSIQGECIACL